VGITRRSARVQLLGGFRVTVGNTTCEGTALPIGAAAVLTLLAFEPRHVLHREQLAEALWPEAPPARAFNNVYKAVHALRHSFGDECDAPEIVHVERCLLSLPAWVRIDVDDFRAAAATARRAPSVAAYEQALAIHGGRRLFDGAEVPRYARDAVRQFDELEEELRFDLADLGGDAVSRASAEPFRPVAPLELPPVRFTRTRDNVRIAYQVLGDGPPLVEMPLYPFNHLQLEWKVPEWRDWHRALSRGRTLVRYDGRGEGMSQRDVRGLPVDAVARDLEAVVDALELRTFDLYSPLHSSLAALHYAALHPERVARLVLWGPCAIARHAGGLPLIRFAHAVAGTNWGWCCRVIARDVMGWKGTDAVEAVARVLIAASDADRFGDVLRDYITADVRHLVPDVRAPALVVYRPAAIMPRVEAVEEVIDALANVTVATLGGEEILPVGNATASVVSMIDAFLEANGPLPLAATAP
jgi:pimeloyl-ACP methyl ester carboxylesterase